MLIWWPGHGHLRRSTADSIAALKKQAMDELTVGPSVERPSSLSGRHRVKQDNLFWLGSCRAASATTSSAEYIRFQPCKGSPHPQLRLRRSRRRLSATPSALGQKSCDSTPPSFSNIRWWRRIRRLPEEREQFEQVLDLVNAANAIVDDTERYEALREARPP